MPLETERRADVVILTAIQLEFDAVLKVEAGALAGSAWEEVSGPSGLPVAQRDFASKGDQPLRVAVARAPDMGATAAVSTLLPLIETLEPRCIAMCGVCAGRRKKVALGDVVAPDRLYYYDTGKQLPGRVEQDLTPYKLRDDWKVALERIDPVALFGGEAWFLSRPLTTEWREQRTLVSLANGDAKPWAEIDPTMTNDEWQKVLANLRERNLITRTGAKLTDAGRSFIDDLLFKNRGKPAQVSPAGADHPLRLHVAPMGSGARVIEDEDIWTFISPAMRKTLGIEMEAVAIPEVAHRQRQRQLDWLVMKGVMDFADHGRDDHFKAFAARAAAECLVWFLRQNLAPASSRRLNSDDPTKAAAPGRSLLAQVATAPVAVSTHELFEDMYARMLAGYSADAVSCAAAIAEQALRVLSNKPLESQVSLSDLIAERRAAGQTGRLHDAAWLSQRRALAVQLVGQVRGELADDAARGCEIAEQFAKAAGLVTEADVAASRRIGALRASEPTSPALLRLDRVVHRKKLDDMLERQQRLAVLLIHGEADQGHQHFTEVMTASVRSSAKGRWREIAIDWPARGVALRNRLVMLLEELAHKLAIEIVLPSADPTTKAGALLWAPTLDRIVGAINARCERLLVHHALRWLDTGHGRDDKLVDKYLQEIWARVASQRGERIVVALNLRRSERMGIPLTRAWRISREEHAVAQSIARTFERFAMPPGGVCATLPELASIPVTDLADWLHLDGGLSLAAARAEAGELVSATRGGRFDLVVNRLDQRKPRT
jgi:nucleoside phosphorylase